METVIESMKHFRDQVESLGRVMAKVNSSIKEKNKPPPWAVDPTKSRRR